MRTATLIRPRGPAGIDLLRLLGPFVFPRGLNESIAVAEAQVRSQRWSRLVVDALIAQDVQYLPLIPGWPDPLPNGTVGVFYRYTLTSSGGWGPKTYFQASGTLPQGLSFDGIDTISGTPTAPTNFLGVSFGVQDSLP